MTVVGMLFVMLMEMSVSVKRYIGGKSCDGGWN